MTLDPFNERELAETIARVIDNPDYRAQLRVKGLERAQAFNWTTTARLTLEVYRRAIENK